MPWHGTRQSDDGRARISAARRQYWIDVRAGLIPKPRTGLHMREDHHRKSSAEKMRKLVLAKGRGYTRTDLSPEARASIGAKNSAALSGRKHSPEWRAKISAALLSTDRSIARQARLKLESETIRSRKGSGKQSLPEKILHDLVDLRRWKFIGCRWLYDCSKNHEFKQYDVPVRADFVNPKQEILLFVDGCYWHNCQECGCNWFPEKSESDRKVTELARSQGWRVVRIWEHEIYDNPAEVLQRLSSLPYLIQGG